MLYVTIFSVANHHVESWICRGQNNLITHHSRQFDSHQQYMDTDTVQPVVVTFPCQQNSIFKILYTGKFLSKQCWDIIMAPIQPRLDLSHQIKNMWYILRTYIQIWILCLLCVRHLWKKEKIPWFKLTLLKMVEFQQQQMLLRNTVIIATVNFKWLHTHLQGSHFRESFNSFLKFAIVALPFIEYHCNSLCTHNLYIVKNLAML